jgi:NAD(P)-dependent dehydrogenase (short-subunit alcohol dehydrogenase family)
LSAGTGIQGQIVFLTGASGGIGREFLRHLARRKAAKIYAADHNMTADLESERVVPLGLDITDPHAVQAAAAACGDVTVLINNAGVNLRAGFIRAPSLDAARREMEVNYFGTLSVCRAFAPALAKNGGGAIVNVLSILAKVTNPALGSYCASKAALLRLTEGIRAELRQQGTRVLAVMPWAVATAMSAAFQGAKSSPAEVAMGALDALEQDKEEVYFGDMAQEINRRLANDAKALEREFGSWLAPMNESGSSIQ